MSSVDHDERVRRFSVTERFIHWSYTAGFAVLLGTGSILWVPELSLAVGNRATVRQLHIIAGIASLAVPAALAVAGERRKVWETVRRLGRFDAEDRSFLLRRPSRPGRFNGGQKLNAMWTLVAGVLFLGSGVVQWQWTWFSPTWRAGASQLHDLLTVVSVVVLAGHVYLSAVHPTTRHSLRGMVGGSVDRRWASAHHPAWFDEAAPGPAEGVALGRRLFVIGVGAGAIAVVTGGRILPRIELPASAGGWRIYNVAGRIPSTDGFVLDVDGMVGRPVSLDLAALQAMSHDEQVSDFECVTGWKVDDVRWRGVRIGDLLALAEPGAGATHITFHSRDGVYTDSLSLADATHPETMIATEMNGRPLPRRHGAPARLVVPTMYGYKSVKWIGRIELTDHEHIGYWEQRGYARDARIDTSGRAEVYAGTRRSVDDLGVSILVPDGWSVEDLPGGGALLRAGSGRGDRVEASVIATPTTVRADRAMTQSMLTGLERAGLTEARYSAVRAGELTADVLQADDGSGQRFLFAFFADGSRVIQVQGQGPSERWGTWGPVFEQLAASLRNDG